MRTALPAVLALLLGSTCAVAQVPSRTKAEHEIEQLFAVLSSSGCEFYRNGDWHGADEAASHLRRKHEYLVKRGLVASAESLIERAASKSSLSGKPYLVKCPGAEAVQSRSWFTRQLARIRSQPVR